MSKWEITNIGDVFTRIKNGASIKQSAGASGLPITRIETIWNSEVDRKKFGFADISDSKKYEDYLLQDKDILMSHINSMKHLAKSALYKKVNGETIIHGMNLICLRTDKEKLDEKFAHYFFNSPSFKNQIPKIANQSVNQSSFSITKFRTLKIPLPPLAIQKQIAELLDTADALRRQTQAQLDQLDALAQSVFLEMFGDPAINPKNFKIESLNKFYINPKEGTKCGPFGSALKKGEYVKKGIAVWVMDNISKKGEFLENYCLRITENKYEQLSGYHVQSGDVIISRAGTVGKMCVVDTSQEKSIISSNLIRVRLDPKKLLPLYFVSLMVGFSDRVGRLRKGEDGAFTHMSTKILDILKFPYPPIILQTQFAKIIKNIESQKSALKQSLQESEDLFNGLLQEVFG